LGVPVEGLPGRDGAGVTGNRSRVGSVSEKYTFIPWARMTKRWIFSRMPSRSLPEKRPHEMSRLRRRAEAASGARALSAVDAEALTAFGEKSGEEGEISSRARC
jgi:hypothetical protein